MVMIGYIRQLYYFCETIPDRLYPFRAEIDGVRRRGRLAYQAAVARARAQYGAAAHGRWLIVYRSAFHVLGSVLVVLGVTVISESLFGTVVGMQVFLVGFISFLFLQEFYWHPRRYAQGRTKSYIDWLTWVVPMVTLGWLV